MVYVYMSKRTRRRFLKQAAMVASGAAILSQTGLPNLVAPDKPFLQPLIQPVSAANGNWVERDYILFLGPDVQTQENNGVSTLQVIDGLIFQALGLNNVVRSGSVQYVDGVYRYALVCDVTALSPQQVADLDNFVAVNNLVLGLYPPRLTSPAVTFVKVANANMLLSAIRTDLVGRGLTRQPSFFIGDTFEYWASSAYAQSQKNRLTDMWANRLGFI